MNGYFFSNYQSPKASQFESHNQVSVLIYWASINTQIRMKARIFKTSAKFSDDHFNSRTKEKNALAISSNQSQPIDSFDEVTKNFYETLSVMIHTHLDRISGEAILLFLIILSFGKVMKID
jgi:pyridoxine/pyridoxamine 5'-phosphate oxidase